MKNLIFTILILLIGVTQVQSQNGFKNLEEHKAFKQSLLDEVKGDFTNSIHPNPSFVQKNLKSGLNDYGDAPDWNWSSQFGGSAADYGRDIIADDVGDIYVAGSFSGEISIGDITYTSIGNRDAIVAKFDNSGNLVWINQLSASVNKETDAYGISIDNDNNIFITGYYTGIITFGDITLPDIANQNLFFAKLNSSGEVMMAKNHGNAGDTETGLKIDTDGNGNIYILGSTNKDTYWRHPSIILRYDQFGNVIWEQQHDESFNDLVVYDSHIYFGALVEDYNDGYIGNGILLEPKGYGEAFIAKSNLNGDFIWASMGDQSPGWGTGDSYGIDLTLDDNENIYLSGFFRYEVIFGSDTLFQSTGQRDGFIVKCSSDGDFIWANRMDEEASDVSVDAANNPYVIFNNYITRYSSEGIGQWTKALNNKPICFTISLSGKTITTGSTDELIFISQLNNNANEEWIVQSEGDSGYGDIIGMETDQSGNFYTYGYASSEMDYFGEIIQKGTFLSKHKPDGEIIWIKQFVDFSLYFNYSYGSYLVIDSVTQSVFITGTFNKPLIIPDITTLTPEEDGSIFIIKYDFDGNYQWSLQEDFSGDLLCLTPDYSGNIILSGTFYGTINIGNSILTAAGGDDIFISKYNTNGEFQWAIRAGGDEGPDYSGLVSTDALSNIYLTGEFTSEYLTVNNYPITLEEGDGNIIFAKISPAGIVQWVTSKAGSTISYIDYHSWPTGINTDAQGYTYIKGWHGDSTYFDNIMLRSPYGSFSYFIAKFDQYGNTMWANSIQEHQYGLDYNQMDIDINGSVYLGAQIRDTIHFGNDFTYINTGENDLFVAKYLTTGELYWVKTMESTKGYNRLSSVAVCDTNHVFIGGQFYNSITFGNSEMLSNNGHGFIAMIDQGNTGVKEVYNRNDNLINIYPNPFSVQTTIEFSNLAHSKYNLSIFNISGNKVFERQNIRSEKIEFERDRLPGGVYIVELKGQKVFRGKMVIE